MTGRAPKEALTSGASVARTEVGTGVVKVAVLGTGVEVTIGRAGVVGRAAVGAGVTRADVGTGVTRAGVRDIGSGVGSIPPNGS